MVVSAGARTRRASETFTGDQQTLNVHNKNSTSFAQKMKKTRVFSFFKIYKMVLIIFKYENCGYTPGSAGVCRGSDAQSQ